MIFQFENSICLWPHVRKILDQEWNHILSEAQWNLEHKILYCVHLTGVKSVQNEASLFQWNRKKKCERNVGWAALTCARRYGFDSWKNCNGRWTLFLLYYFLLKTRLNFIQVFDCVRNETNFNKVTFRRASIRHVETSFIRFASVFFLWASGSAYTFSGIFFSVNQILFTNKTNYFQSLALLYGNVPLIQHSILIGHEHNVQMFQTETTNHISYSSFRLIPAMIEFAMHSTATMRFSRKLDNICSPMNCWSIYFRSKFSILLLLIAFTTHNFFCLAECSFAVLLFAAITQTSLFALALARSLLFPFPVNKNTELSFVTTNGSTNSI